MCVSMLVHSIMSMSVIMVVVVGMSVVVMTVRMGVRRRGGCRAVRREREGSNGLAHLRVRVSLLICKDVGATDSCPSHSTVESRRSGYSRTSDLLPSPTVLSETSNPV